MEWYLKVRNKTLEAKEDTGSEDIYTRADLEAGLMRIGWREHAIREVLDNTKLFRNVSIPFGLTIDGSPWTGLTTVVCP